MQKRNIVIINSYRPPDCHTEKISSPLNEFRTKLIEIGNPMPNNIIFTEDLNFPIIDWPMETAGGGTLENRFKQMPFCNLHRNNTYSNIYRSQREKITYSMSF